MLRTCLEHRGGDGKALAMWAFRHYGGRTLREMGKALGGLDYAAVSIAIKRLARKAASETSLKNRGHVSTFNKRIASEASI